MQTSHILSFWFQNDAYDDCAIVTLLLCECHTIFVNVNDSANMFCTRSAQIDYGIPWTTLYDKTRQTTNRLVCVCDFVLPLLASTPNQIEPIVIVIDICIFTAQGESFFASCRRLHLLFVILFRETKMIWFILMVFYVRMRFTSLFFMIFHRNPIETLMKSTSLSHISIQMAFVTRDSCGSFFDDALFVFRLFIFVLYFRSMHNFRMEIYTFRQWLPASQSSVDEHDMQRVT